MDIKISIPKKVINKYIFYILNQWSRDLNTEFTLVNCLFWSVKLDKTADPDKYMYGGYNLDFVSLSKCSLTDGSVEKMSLFLDQIWTHLCILIIREKIS